MELKACRSPRNSRSNMSSDVESIPHCAPRAWNSSLLKTWQRMSPDATRISQRDPSRQSWRLCARRLCLPKSGKAHVLQRSISCTSGSGYGHRSGYLARRPRSRLVVGRSIWLPLQTAETPDQDGAHSDGAPTTPTAASATTTTTAAATTTPTAAATTPIRRSRKRGKRALPPRRWDNSPSSSASASASASAHSSSPVIDLTGDSTDSLEEAERVVAAIKLRRSIKRESKD
ncbi:unnamed protein product [Jaminaea pallidilutea]